MAVGAAVEVEVEVEAGVSVSVSVQVLPQRALEPVQAPALVEEVVVVVEEGVR